MNFDTPPDSEQGEDLEQALKEALSEVKGNVSAARMFRDNAAELMQRARDLEKQAEGADLIAQDRQRQVFVLQARIREKEVRDRPKA